MSPEDLAEYENALSVRKRYWGIWYSIINDLEGYLRCLPRRGKYFLLPDGHPSLNLVKMNEQLVGRVIGPPTVEQVAKVHTMLAESAKAMEERLERDADAYFERTTGIKISGGSSDSEGDSESEEDLEPAQ